MTLDPQSVRAVSLLLKVVEAQERMIRAIASYDPKLDAEMGAGGRERVGRSTGATQIPGVRLDQQHCDNWADRSRQKLTCQLSTRLCALTYR